MNFNSCIFKEFVYRSLNLVFVLTFNFFFISSWNRYSFSFGPGNIIFVCQFVNYKILIVRSILLLCETWFSCRVHSKLLWSEKSKSFLLKNVDLDLVYFQWTCEQKTDSQFYSQIQPFSFTSCWNKYSFWLQTKKVKLIYQLLSVQNFHTGIVLTSTQKRYNFLSIC